MLGVNDIGQLGDGTTTDRYAPPTNDVLTGVLAIAAGDEHTCALMTTGSIRCWGYNLYGQLGDGTATNRTAPSPDLLTGVQTVALGLTIMASSVTAPQLTETSHPRVSSSEPLSHEASVVGVPPSMGTLITVFAKLSDQ